MDLARVARALPLALLTAALPVQASAVPKLRLELSHAEGVAERCEPAALLEARVAERLGIDPFSEPAEQRVSVQLRLDGGGRDLRALLRIESLASAELLGERELTSQDCGELYDAVAVSLGVVLDPLGRLEGANARPTEVARTPLAPEPPAEHEPSPSSSLRLDAWAAPWVSGGAGPGVSAGFRVGAAVSLSALRLGLEGSYDLPTEEAVRRGPSRIKVGLIAARALGCFQPGIWFVCAAFAAGAHRATGLELENAVGVTTPYAGAGARLGVELALAGPLAVRAEIEGLVALSRTILRVSDEPVWTSPDGAFGFGLAIDYALFDGSGSGPRRNPAAHPK